MEQPPCAKLRSKHDYFIKEGRSDYPPMPRIYWCLETMTAFGPDDDDANPDRCAPGRDCYCSSKEPQ